jgi:la-related protein 1
MNIFIFSEYYFSLENLEKDFYLRRKMTPDGYLPIAVIANFPRIKNMIQDLILVRKGIQLSTDLELSPDSTSVRTKNEPTKWPIEDEAGKDLPKFAPSHPPLLMTYPQPPLQPTQLGISAISPILPGSSIISPVIGFSPIPIPVYSPMTPPVSVPLIPVEMLNPNVPEFVPSVIKVPNNDKDSSPEKATTTTTPATKQLQPSNLDKTVVKMDNQKIQIIKKEVVDEKQTTVQKVEKIKDKVSPEKINKSKSEVEVSWQEVKKKPKPVSKRRLTSIEGGGDADYQTQFMFEEDVDLPPARARTYSSGRYSV